MKSQRSKWIVVGLLWAVAVLNYVDRQVLFALFAPIQTNFQLSSLELGLLSSVFLWVYGLLSPISGFLGDRFGRKRVIVPSLLVWSLVTSATGQPRNFQELFLVRALMGISEACYLPAALAMISDHHPERSRSLATALHQTGIYSGLVLGGVGGGWLGQRYGWRLAFTFLGLIGVLYVVVLFFALKEADSRVAEEQASAKLQLVSSIRELFSLPGFLSMLVVFSGLSIANWTVYTWLPLYLYERFQMSLTAAGFSATFYVQVAGVTGTLLGGRIADQWSRRTPRGRLLTQVVGLMGAAPFLILAGSTAVPAVLVASLVAFGLGKGFYECNVMPVLSQVARPDLRSTGFGVFNFAASSTAGFTAAGAGALKSVIGLGGAMQVAGTVLFFSGILLLRVHLSSAVPVTPGQQPLASGK